MSEIPTIPWGRVFSNFVWILGTAIILAAFSYYELLAHIQKTKVIDILKKDTFKKPFLLGLIFIAVGISASLQNPLLAAIIGIVAFLLIIWFVKFIKIKAPEKKETKD